MSATKKSDRRSRDDRYWERRVRSPAFKRDLVALITTELQTLARERVRDVVDPEAVRITIREWNGRVLNEQVAADLAIKGSRRAAARLRKQTASVRGRLGPHLAHDLDALLQQGARLSRHAEDFIAEMMQQEFVRRLFSDILFTSLVAFQEKVNPLFGGIAMRFLEERIRGFIDLFMPMLQQQAAAFAVNRDNQRVVLDFFRSIISYLLDEPLSHYAAMTASEQSKTLRTLLRKAIADAAGDKKLEQLTRDMALAFWDDVYGMIRHKRVGELLRLDEHAGWLAERAAAGILPVLSRAGVMQFVTAELARAAKTH